MCIGKRTKARDKSGITCNVFDNSAPVQKSKQGGGGGEMGGETGIGRWALWGWAIVDNKGVYGAAEERGGGELNIFRQ